MRNATGRYLISGLSPETAAARQRQNVASLDRKITFCLRRPGERLHWQRVEGWTPEQVVVARMRAAGIPAARITRDLRGH